MGEYPQEVGAAEENSDVDARRTVSRHRHLGKRAKGLIVLAAVAVVGLLAWGVFNLFYADKSLYTIKGSTSDITNIRWSADGMRILCGRSASLDVYDMATHARILQLKDADSMAVRAYESADGTAILGVWGTSTRADGEVVDTWDATSGESESTIDVAGAHTYYISDDSRYVAVDFEEAGTEIEIWDLQSDTLVSSMTASAAPLNIVFSSDDARIAVSEENAVEVMDVETGASLATAAVTTDIVETDPDVCFTADGSYLLASVYESGRNSEGDTVSVRCTFVYDAESLEPVRTIDGFKLYNTSPDGKYVIGMDTTGTGNDVIDTVTGHRGLEVVDLATGKVVMSGIQGHAAGIIAAAFSPDMSYIATAGSTGDIKVWEFTPTG